MVRPPYISVFVHSLIQAYGGDVKETHQISLVQD